MRGEPGIHAIRVGLKLTLRVRGQSAETALRQPIEPQRADELVYAELVGAGYLRQPSLPSATLHLHLKQPFARMNVAERASGVVPVGGEDVRHAPAIAVNVNLGGQAGEGSWAAVIRHRAFEYKGGGSRSSRDDQSNGEKASLPKAAAFFGEHQLRPRAGMTINLLKSLIG